MSNDGKEQIDWLSDQIAQAQIIIDGIHNGEKWFRSHDGNSTPDDVTEQVLRDYQRQVDMNLVVLEKWLAKSK
ncbi:hypothetical protein [Mesorhizobium wenxiniae]|nr:hypothetical protein [Mesorhizobium wenxiniae]